MSTKVGNLDELDNILWLKDSTGEKVLSFSKQFNMGQLSPQVAAFTPYLFHNLRPAFFNSGLSTTDFFFTNGACFI